MKKKFTLSNILSVLLLLILIVFIFLLITNHRFYYVKTSSMEPDIHQWSLICDKVYKDKNKFYENISVDTDITFRTKEGTVTTHRIIFVDKENDIIQTKGIKGDAVADEMISFNQVLGVVTFSIPILGFLVMLCQTWYFWTMLICSIIIYLIIKELMKKPKNINN